MSGADAASGARTQDREAGAAKRQDAPQRQDAPNGAGSPSAPSRFVRLGRFVARHPGAVVAAWLVLIAVAAPLAPRAPGVLSAGGFTTSDLESARARQLLEQQVGLPPSALVVVIQSETAARAGQPAFETAVARAIARVPQAKYVVGMVPHTMAPRQVSADGRTVYELVNLDLSPDDSPKALATVQAAIRPQPGLKIYLAGGPAFYGDIQTVSEADLRRSELISLPLAALALLLVFGSGVAAGVPLAVGGTAVLISLAVIFLAASLTPMSIFVLNLTTLLGLGLGVDYSLLMTSRFREELHRRGGGRGPDGQVDRGVVEEAVVVTVASAGRAVFFSGLTVLLGLSGMVLFDFMVLRSVGLAGALVVGLAVLSAMSLLPALLTLLGPRIDALAVRPCLARVMRRAGGGRGAAGPAVGSDGAARETGSPTAGSAEPTREVASPAAGAAAAGDAAEDDRQLRGFWGRLAWWVMERPVRVFVPTLAILLLVGVPFLHVRFNAPDASILPPSVPSRQGFDILVRSFGVGEFDPLLLAIRTDGPATSPANIAELYAYSRRLAADPRVTRVDSIVNLDPRLTLAQYELLYESPGGVPDRFAATELQATTKGDLTTFTVTTPYGPNAPQARALVAALRDPHSALAPPAGMHMLVAGGAAEVTDVVNKVGAEFPRTAIFILIATYLALFVLLRSVILPAKALVMNTLSIVASFGALVWIFQDGNLSALLGFQPLGYVETTQPVILFCVLFGLSMDYEVFLLSRMKEVYDRTGDNRMAVARGLERSGRIVTSAALIVVVVASSFAFADIVLIKALGLGVAIAVALDATVVRALLVPATMRLLGDWNWWIPQRLARWIATRLPVIEQATIVQLGVLLVIAALLVGACSPQGRLLGVDASTLPAAPTAAPTPTPPSDPRPLRFPADEAPHNRLTEWWYYTGHLRTSSGAQYGFEFVIFRAERGAFPVSWAAHLALTDQGGGRFVYDQRSEIGPQVDLVAAATAQGASPAGGAPSSSPGTHAAAPPIEPGIGPQRGFALSIVGGDAMTRSAALAAGVPAWTMEGIDGHDTLVAASPSAGFGFDLSLQDQLPAPVLENKDGWVDFGPAGGSYYYSRPRMAVRGNLSVGGRTMAVTGEAWFDHQWGNFIAVGAGGWDWYAVNLSDGTDVMLSMVRDASGGYPLVYGTLVRPDGTTEHLARDSFTVQVTNHWTSSRTGATYPAGWVIRIPTQQLEITLKPTVADQELDTRATSGVVYWEGSQLVSATRAGRPLDGEAYVELTGYGPSLAPGSAAPLAPALPAIPTLPAIPRSPAAGAP